jgi:predicted TIM-barrel fold metal-dependent hydrolase
MVNTDGHASEPPTLYAERIEAKFRDRLPRVITDEKGVRWTITEGIAPQRIYDPKFDGEDLERAQAGVWDPEVRLRDHARDGIDAEIIFPGRGLMLYQSQDPEFVMAQARVWNDWAMEVYGPYNDRLSPAAAIGTADVDLAVAEVERTAKMGFRSFALPVKPIPGAGNAADPNYNLPIYDRLWAAIQDSGQPIVFHVGSGKDPRGAKGPGGAIVNYAVHALTPAVEPVANLCCSGALDRYPRLKFATIESGIGWVPWLLWLMDEAYYKHHFWVSPKLELLPGEYFRRNGASTFQEDPIGLSLAREHNLVRNFMWASDYPHHEGTWPHSAQAIERMMGGLNDWERGRIVGLNAADFFGFEVSAAQRD